MGLRTRRSNSSSTADMGRLSKAVQRPGIDPRVWGIRGWVKAFYFDEEHGPFVDVVLQSGEEETARVGAMYAGPGYGFYVPLEPDDEVLLDAPMGNYNSGLVVVARLWSKSDPPPAAVKDHPADLLLVVKKDANLRLQVSGSGNVVFKVDQGKILLGDETGTSPVTRVGDKVNMGTWQHVPAAGAGVTPCQLLWTPPQDPATPLVPPVPAPVVAPRELDGRAKEGSEKTESA